MSYIGNQPAESYASFLTETFTVSATANYTLSHSVTNENEIRLVINGVVQQPGSGKAYTASGTTLTLSSATVSGDVMYAVYLGRALQTVNPPAGSVGASQISDSSIALGKLSATGTKSSSTFLRGDNTFAVPGGGKVLQVLTATDSTHRTTTSTSFVTASNTLSVDITPSATSSKIFVQASFEAGTNSGSRGFWTIYRDSSNLGNANGMFSVNASNDVSGSMTFLDSPSSTSQLTYAVYMKSNATACHMTANTVKSSIVVMEIGA
jgi:hypothetical protein